jgi:DNA topoisomerase-2
MGALYVGGNNIPYLFRDGQFGTRLQGGEDASDGRYIHTKMDMLTDILFKKVDEKLLENKEDDGEIVEPKYYVPILPMILVNGTLGIGTGWSSNIPCYNPKDIIQCIKIWLEKNGEIFEENEEGKLVSLLPELYPWYNGFTGEITKEDDTKYISWGKIERNGKKVHVTELPIGYWSNDFEQFLMDLKADKEIKDYKANQNPNIVDFTIVEDDDGLKCDLKNLKLSKVIRTTNMVLFDENGKLKKYNSADEILDNFCKVRLEYYEKRKKYLERNLEYEIKYMGNKRRFLEEVRDNEIKFFVEYTENGKIKRKSKPRKEMIVILEERKFDKKLDDKENEADENDEEDNEEDEEKSKKKRKSNKHGYEYLLALNIDGFTEEKINKLRNDIENKEKELEVIKSTTEKEMWINDLEDFEEKYQKWLNSVDKEKSQITKVKKTRKTKKGQED